MEIQHKPAVQESYRVGRREFATRAEAEAYVARSARIDAWMASRGEATEPKETRRRQREAEVVERFLEFSDKSMQPGNLTAVR